MEFLLTIVSVAIGGAFGALLRFGFSLKFDKNRFNFPLGTFIANMLASFILGLILSFSENNQASILFLSLTQAGFCSTLSTFSSLASQIATMIESKNYKLATIYTLTTFICGIACFAIAYKLF